MVSLPHRSTHISIVRSNGMPESSVTPGPDRYVTRPNGAPINPTCGHTLCLGSQKGTRGLGQCSTRQPTVYSYTASHRSPLFRVDSPTRYHQHHCVHSIPTHQHNILIVSLSSNKQ